MGSLASRRRWRELCGPAERERPPSGLHVGGPGRQLFNAPQFFVYTLERSRKHLLAVERPVNCTGKTPAARLGFAPTLTLLLACQGAFLAAQLP
jgi:hypothetical protein